MEQLAQHQADGLLVVDLGVHIQTQELHYLEVMVVVELEKVIIPLVVMELLTLVAVEVVLVEVR
jgi:hypothetical protein